MSDPWYMSKWVLALSLVLLPPLGIFLLWRFHDYEDRTKGIVSAGAGVWLLIAVVASSAGEAESPATEPTRTAAPVADATDMLPDQPSFEIATTEDFSYNNVPRVELRVVVPSGTTRDDLVAIAEVIASEQRSLGQYSAVSIVFGDAAELVAVGGPLGVAYYAPGGDWSRADEARPDYSTHELDTSMLKEKDWSMQPTEADRTVWASVVEYKAQTDTIDDEEAAAAVAPELGLSVEDTVARYRAVSQWIYS